MGFLKVHENMMSYVPVQRLKTNNKVHNKPVAFIKSMHLAFPHKIIVVVNSQWLSVRFPHLSKKHFIERLNIPKCCYGKKYS